MEEYIIDISIIFLLILANGILAMIEIAMVSANRIKMNDMAQKSKSAKIASQLIDNPGRLFSTIQIGITIISILLGAFSAQKFAEPLGKWLNNIPWVYGYGTFISFTFIILIVTYFSLVFGEIAPKSIAFSKPEKIAIFFAKPIQFLSKLTYPFVIILDISTKITLMLLGQKQYKKSIITEEEIYSAIKQGLKEGAIDAFEHSIFQKVLQFDTREARIIMTPRIKVISLDLDAEPAENKNKILSTPHRYYPIFEDSPDNLKGIIDTQDILLQQIRGQAFDLKVLIKKAPCVIEDTLGPDLIDQFIKHKTHIAVVVDEYGIMQGIVTLTDIFETLISKMPDAHQKKHYDIVQRSEDGSWLCDGLTPIDDIEELLQIPILSAFKESVDFDTLAGFLLLHFKHIPKTGETTEWNQFVFEVMDMDGTRIDKVLIRKNKIIPDEQPE